VHPFNDEDVIAGQGTIALELVEQLHDLDAVVVPIGGGGLISGIAYTLKTLKPSVKVYGVQASGAPSMKNSIEGGEIAALNSVSTIADGIAVKKPGDLTYDFCKKYVDDIVTVTDDEISSAILALMEKHKLVTEGAGAVAVAAVMFGKLPLEGKKTVCILSGGNIDVNILSRVINRGLIKSGRSSQLLIELQDRPGALKNVARVISDFGGNIMSVQHERSNEGLEVNGCYLRIILETRNYEHNEQIRQGLRDFGFNLVD
jgi:threonine dehydratase